MAYHVTIPWYRSDLDQAAPKRPAAIRADSVLARFPVRLRRPPARLRCARLLATRGSSPGRKARAAHRTVVGRAQRVPLVYRAGTAPLAKSVAARCSIAATARPLHERFVLRTRPCGTDAHR